MILKKIKKLKINFLTLGCLLNNIKFTIAIQCIEKLSTISSHTFPPLRDPSSLFFFLTSWVLTIKVWKFSYTYLFVISFKKLKIILIYEFVQIHERVRRENWKFAILKPTFIHLHHCDHSYISIVWECVDALYTLILPLYHSVSSRVFPLSHLSILPGRQE